MHLFCRTRNGTKNIPIQNPNCHSVAHSLQERAVWQNSVQKARKSAAEKGGMGLSGCESHSCPKMPLRGTPEFSFSFFAFNAAPFLVSLVLIFNPIAVRLSIIYVVHLSRYTLASKPVVSLCIAMARWLFLVLPFRGKNDITFYCAISMGTLSA